MDNKYFCIYSYYKKDGNTSDWQCKKCDSSCYTCNGSASTSCKSCLSGGTFYLKGT